MKRRDPEPEAKAEPSDITRMAIAMHRRSLLDHPNREVARQAAEELRDLSRAPSPDMQKALAIYHRLPWRTP